MIAQSVTQSRGLGRAGVAHDPRSITGYGNGRLGTAARQGGAPAQNTQVSFMAEAYSSERLSITYRNGDGDSVSLSMEQIEYQKTLVSAKGNENSEQWHQVVENIKEQYLALQERIISRILDGIDGGNREPKVEEDAPASSTTEIPGLPEYWNAENTSQRIVDFATSFYGLTESAGQDFYELMVGAIEEGFSQARGLLGKLPGAVDNLVTETHELTLQKLEAWALEQGIEVRTEQVPA